MDSGWTRPKSRTDQFAEFVKATKYVTLCREGAARRGFSRRAAGKSRSRVGGPCAARSSGESWERPLPVVELREGRQLASSGGTTKSWEVRIAESIRSCNIAYEDAVAYAKWAGKRLPTEAELEFAQRGRLERKPYTWGDELKPGGKFMANTFQGHFQIKNTKEDGHERAAPVGSFPPNPYGLYEHGRQRVANGRATGIDPTTIRQLADGGTALARNPQGPADSHSIPASPA